MTRPQLNKAHAAVTPFSSLIANESQDIKQSVRALMIPTLQAMCGMLAARTRKRIALIFRMQLDKLQGQEGYDGHVSERKNLEEIITSLKYYLITRLPDSQELKDRLDALQQTDDARINPWVELIYKISTLRRKVWMQ